MRILSGIVSATLLMPALALAEEAKEQQIHDKPAVRGSIIANLLQEHDNPFTLYPYDPNYLLYTDTSDINKEAIKTYNWADKARKDEVKYQLSSWRFRCGGALPATARCSARLILSAPWWQLSNRGESSPFRETNYEPQLFVGWATDYRFAGWTLRDVEIGVNHQSNGRSDPTSRSWNRGYARLMAQNGNWQVDLKPRFRFSGELEQRRQPGHHQIHGILPAEGRLRLGRQRVQRRQPLQLEQRLRRRGTGLELSDYPQRALLYPGVQRLRRIADRLQLPADTGGRWCHAERYYVIIPGGCVPMKKWGSVCQPQQ